jgi:hypothetical protein
MTATVATKVQKLRATPVITCLQEPTNLQTTIGVFFEAFHKDCYGQVAISSTEVILMAQRVEYVHCGTCGPRRSVVSALRSRITAEASSRPLPCSCNSR